MRYPLVLSSHKQLVIVPEGWFSEIGLIEPEKSKLEIAISSIGEKSLAWFLDADGFYYTVDWCGRISKTFFQTIGLRRQRELYTIEAPRAISARNLLELIQDHRDQFEEAPNTADLRNALLAVFEETIIGRDFMRSYLGERHPREV
jgi:hypothetical protein